MENRQKHKKNSCFKARTTMIMFFLILTLAQINLVSAFEFDNVKSYDSKTRTVTITNAFGLGDDIATAKLISEDIVWVTPGYKQVAEFELNLLQDYSIPIEKIDAYNARDMGSINRNFDYKYWISTGTRDIFQTMNGGCLIQNVNGSCDTYKSFKQIINTVDEGYWADFNNVNMKIGIVKIGIFTTVYKGDYVEWIPTLFEKEISEWAVYGAVVEVTHGIALNQACGGGNTVQGTVVNITANINMTSFNATQCVDAGKCYIVNVSNEATNCNSSAPLKTGTYSAATSLCTWSGNMELYAGDEVGLVCDWAVGLTPCQSSTGVLPLVNGSITFSNSYYALAPTNCNIGTKVMQVTGVSYQDEVIVAAPFNITADLIAPGDNFETLDTNVTFTGNFTVSEGNFTNATLFVWNPDTTLFGTNTTLITGNYTNTSTLSLSNLPRELLYKWNYYVCGLNTSLNAHCVFNSTNRTFSITSFTEINSSYNFIVNETSEQKFELNIQTIPSILSVTAAFNYNGSKTTGTVSCVGSSCLLSKTIDIPLVTEGTTQNKSFVWELTIFDGTTSSSLNSTTQEQNVSKIHLEQCNATWTTKTLNFTTFVERNLSRLSLFSFDGTFEFWIGSGTIKRNNSFSENITEMNLCLHPNATLKIDATIDYDEAGNTTFYTSRFYHFDTYNITNTLEHIKLYLLESTSSTSFILKVQDENLLPVSDALIEIHRFYPGEGVFKIVQIAKTDDNGKSIGFFETETVDYKFIIKKAGETLLATGTQKVVPEVSPFTLTFNTGTDLGEPWEVQNEISNLESSLIWDEDTGIATYNYIDSSGTFTQGRFLVQLTSLTNSSAYVIICNDTSSLASAIMTCNVGNDSGFYIAGGYITRVGEALDRQIGFQIETFSSAAGLLGLFFGWFLILIAAFMFRFNEIAGIWSTTVTIFLVNIIGLIKFGAVFVSALIFIAIILTWIMEK